VDGAGEGGGGSVSILARGSSTQLPRLSSTQFDDGTLDGGGCCNGTLVSTHSPRPIQFDDGTLDGDGRNVALPSKDGPNEAGTWEGGVVGDG
jgi:hypothetical protein